MQRGHVGEIISRFEKKGMVMTALKPYQCPKAVAEEHYQDLPRKPLFGDLVNYICPGPAAAMLWEGPAVVQRARSLFVPTNPPHPAPAYASNSD